MSLLLNKHRDDSGASRKQPASKDQYVNVVWVNYFLQTESYKTHKHAL